MTPNFEKSFNSMLVDTFNQIKRVEEASLRSLHKSNLSINEYHMLECIGKNGDEGRTISEIAADLMITSASVTIMVNKLQQKKYVEKIKKNADGRCVNVRLTREGRKVDAGHRMFHSRMARDLSSQFSEEELALLVKCIEKINEYFSMNSKINKQNNMPSDTKEKN